MNTSTGVIVGRFQVAELTDAHLELLTLVGEYHNGHVIVFVGVNASMQPTKHDPLDYETRRRMIQQQFPTYSIAPLMDQKTDELWSDLLDASIRAQVQFGKVFLYGGRDSFAPYYKGNYEIKNLELTLHPHISGTTHRQKISDFVLDTADFRAGIIYGMENSYSRILPCIDIAIVCRSDKHSAVPTRPVVLLGRRKTEPKWRFIGGHAEKNSSYEDDAVREAFEEAGVRPTNLEYVGSGSVQDWRFKNTSEQIKTSFYVGYVPNLSCKAGDDINEVSWHNLMELSKDDFEVEHQFLFNILKRHLQLD